MIESSPPVSLPPEDREVFIKALFHLTRKARPYYADGVFAGYIVPKREFERVRAKFNLMLEGMSR